MNDLAKNLLRALQGLGSGSKAVAALVAVAVALVIAAAAFVSSRPHYSMLLSGLGDHEAATVGKALSEAGIPFRVSQPPAPFVVYVDDGDHSKALQAAYGAGALDRPLKGILSDGGGMASVFMSAREREQMVVKREWEEMEAILEELDFVSSARVRSSPADRSPFASKAPPVTGSVQLHVKGRAELGRDQAEAVVLLVSRGLGIGPEHLTISDQLGRVLHDGAERSEDGADRRDWLAHKEKFDRAAAAKANEVLAEILGPGSARVTVDSRWDFEQSTETSTTAAKGAVRSETRTSTETPFGGPEPGGRPVGTASNVADPDGPDPAGEPEVAAAEPRLATTSEERKEYEPSKTTVQRVRQHPRLERLSVALFLDDEVSEDRAAALVDAVKASVGFDESRGDYFSPPVRIAFASGADTSGEDGAGEPAEELAEPSRLLETLLGRGVEIATAVAFLLVLVRALRAGRSAASAKGARAARSARTDAPGARASGDEPDPEVLAQVQVKELLERDPARVARILSDWAREESATGAAR